ncbi:MAG TPA: type III pantothenate kinase [Methylomirabilota bacterium]|nr:type III pantothenate kinase [Methylomirabilota bacterium]
MLLLCDIGNTHTHLAWATTQRVVRHRDLPTGGVLDGSALAGIRAFAQDRPPAGVALCSVVPRATRALLPFLRRTWRRPVLELGPHTVTGVGIDYPRPHTIGPDRLANAIAAAHCYGAPVVVVDFGTAVTFDVVNRRKNYVGGIIAPGLAAMTDYLHEKTALLPRIRIRETRRVVGRSTREAMLVGAVHGYRGLVRELIHELRRELKCPELPVVATGGCAALIARGLPEITTVNPLLTLEGLRLAWLAWNAAEGS